MGVQTQCDAGHSVDRTHRFVLHPRRDKPNDVFVRHQNEQLLARSKPVGSISSEVELPSIHRHSTGCSKRLSTTPHLGLASGDCAPSKSRLDRGAVEAILKFRKSRPSPQKLRQWSFLPGSCKDLELGWKKWPTVIAIFPFPFLTPPHQG